MSKRITLFVSAFGIVAFTVFAIALNSLGARALTSNEFAIGYWSHDGWWLGSYGLDDGSRGFCLEAGSHAPVGFEMDYADGTHADAFSPDDAARLAYISREWAGTSDQRTAAAGQLATWMVAGLHGKTPESYASRAGGDAGVVLARAMDMVDEASRLGTRGVSAEATVELAARGAGRLRVELLADRLPAGPTAVEPHQHRGTVTLGGATFADGSTTAEIENGVDYAITPTGVAPTVHLTAQASFADLPYGNDVRVAIPRGQAQSLLVAMPARAEAGSSADRVGPSPLPFQPVVETQVSDATTTPGSSVHDRLSVGVRPGDGLLSSWGVFETPEGMSPIEVTIVSRLLGPFDGPIERSTTTPADAPVVCEVEVTVSAPGDYDTDACVLEHEGTYVWVERIDPAQLPSGRGGGRVGPWQSDFGIASETTIVASPPAPAPAVVATATPAPATMGPTEALAQTGSNIAFGPLAAGCALIPVGLALLAVTRWRAHRIRRVHR